MKWSDALTILGVLVLGLGVVGAFLGAGQGGGWIGALPGIVLAFTSFSFFLFAAIFERLDRILALVRDLSKGGG